MTTEYTLSYYPWITQHRDPGDIRQAINDFATAVEAAGKCKITVLKPISVPDQVEWIGKGERRIGLMNPLGFVLAKAASAAIDAINVAMRQKIDVGPDGVGHRIATLVPSYRAQLYTNVKTAIKRTSDADFLKQVRRPAGVSMAFGTPYSTSNFLFPAWMARARLNVCSLTSFTSIAFLGGHDVVAKAVYAGTVDMGAGHDGVLEDLGAQPGFGDAEERLTTLYWTDEIPSDPVVANVADDAERKALADAFVQASKTDAGRGALQTFWGGVPELAVQKSDAYESIAQGLKYMNLRGIDLLTP